MSATVEVRPRTLEDALREETDLAEIGREFAGAGQELVEESRAEARAAGRQYRLLHRLWQLQEEAREQRWAVEAHWIPPEADRLGPHSLEPEEQTLRDVADEIGPALRLPAGTAPRRVQDAVLLAESLPEVLEALEQGRVGVRQAGVVVELRRELVADATDSPQEQRAPVEAVGRIAEELLRRAPESAVAQLRALARRTVPQVRADVLADLLLDAEPADLPEHLRGVRGHVTVTVLALALLERIGEGFPLDGVPRTSRCAELEGYGPIPVSMAERIAARAPF